jgi:hypothetical protein
MRRTVLSMVAGMGRKETGEAWMRMKFENGGGEGQAEEQSQPEDGRGEGGQERS